MDPHDATFPALCLCRVCRHARVARVDAYAAAVVERHAAQWAREEAQERALEAAEWQTAWETSLSRERRHEAPTVRPRAAQVTAQ